MKLKKIIVIRGDIETLSGLAVGGASDDLEINGFDSEVIKNPLTKEPYIPGSSLKGKMRAELEKTRINYKEVIDRQTREKRLVIEEKEPCGCGTKDCMVCVVFGAYKNVSSDSAPTRIIVRDCPLTEASREKIRQAPGGYLERKIENVIERNTGVANTPRTVERVAAGVEFQMEILLKVFAGDAESKMLTCIRDSLELLELSYLGGSGSRGYGSVCIKNIELKAKNVEDGTITDITERWTANAL